MQVLAIAAAVAGLGVFLSTFREQLTVRDVARMSARKDAAVVLWATAFALECVSTL